MTDDRHWEHHDPEVRALLEKAYDEGWERGVKWALGTVGALRSEATAAGLYS